MALELGRTNVLALIPDAQFASISTASNLVNTVLPLIGGTIMDYYGTH